MKAFGWHDDVRIDGGCGWSTALRCSGCVASNWLYLELVVVLEAWFELYVTFSKDFHKGRYLNCGIW
jgi:hypothetical protein